MIKDKLSTLFILVMLISCKINKPSCEVRNFKDLSLTAVNTTIKIPVFITIDSMRYGDRSNIFEREVKSLDSSFVVFAGIESYEKKPEAMPDINDRMISQKEEVES